MDSLNSSLGPDFSQTTTLIVGLGLLLAAYVKGVTAMGFPLIATPMVALLLDVRTAIAILVLPNILMDFTQAFREGTPILIFRRFASLLLMAVFGVFVGTKALVSLPVWILNLVLGITILMFIFARSYTANHQISANAERFLSPLVGLCTGFLNGMTNVAGPALALYLYGLGLTKTDFVRSIATIFIINKVGQLVALSTWNVLTFANLQLSLFVCVFIAGGFYLGIRTQDRMSQKLFNTSVTTVVVIFGAMLIFSAFR